MHQLQGQGYTFKWRLKGSLLTKKDWTAESGEAYVGEYVFAETIEGQDASITK